VEDFINCKHGRQKIEYMDPRLEEILEETYGVILYQEQVMRVASDLASFTMGEADVLRRAMGKKKAKELMAQREKFIAGAARNNISEDVSSRLFDLMESFAGYGFNKSHSAAYAMITYQTAYLKAFYPQEFMCAFLTSVIDHQDRVVFYIKECKAMGIEILPPDINESFETFTVGTGGIRFGLGAIKNVGINTVKTIVNVRKQGKFSSLFDFCKRIDLSQINKRVMENLIVAGCFDSLGITRKQALSMMDECMELAAQIKLNENSNQLSLFGDSEDLLIEEPQIRVQGELDKRERMTREKEVLGFYVSQNPLDQYRSLIPLVSTADLDELEKSQREDYVRVAGIPGNLSKKVSRKGEPYARFQLEDLTASMEMMIFPSAYQNNINKIESDQAVVVEGFLDRRDEPVKISVRRVAVLSSQLRELNVRLPYEKTDDEGKKELLAILRKHPGEMEVILHLPNRKVIALDEKYNVAASMQLKQELCKRYGKSNVWYG